MTVPDWPLITSVAPEDLVEATLELHWAVQLIASAGQTFAEPRPDDSHRAMQWDGSLRAFVGSPFAGPYPFRVAIRPEDLTLVLIDRTDGALGTLPLVGTTHDEAHEWMSLGVATYLGGPPPRLERPEYDMPEHSVGEGARFTGGDEAARAALTALYDGAARLIAEVVAGHERASEIRCWPHHLNIAALLSIGPEDTGGAASGDHTGTGGGDDAPASGAARAPAAGIARAPAADALGTVGVGLAPMGGGFDGWYLYVTPSPYPSLRALPDLGRVGVWHTEGWTGAVLTGEDVGAMASDERDARVRRFLRTSVAVASEALRGP